TVRACNTAVKRRTMQQNTPGPRLDNEPWPGRVTVYLLPARYAERPRAGLFFPAAPAASSPEPPAKRKVGFIDGLDPFHAAREAFGYTYTPLRRSCAPRRPCDGRGWRPVRTRSARAFRTPPKTGSGFA